MKKFFLFFYFSVTCAFALGQSPLFQKMYEVLGYSSYGRSVLPLQNKNYLLTGNAFNSGNNTSEALIMLVDSVGDIIWTKQYLMPSGSINEFKTLLLEDSSLIIITSNYSNPASAVLLKCDPAGNLIWSKRFHNLPFQATCAYDGCQLSNGNLAFCGLGQSSNNSSPYIFSTDTAGNLLWGKLMNGNDPVMYTSLKSLSSGGLVVIGSDGSGTQASLDKFDNSGNLIWHHKYNFPSNFSASTIETACLDTANDGGFIIGGEHVPTFNTYHYQRPFILRTDTAGNVLWCKVYTLPSDIIAEAFQFGMCRTFDDGIAMTMENELPLPALGFYQFGVFKTDSVGNLQWSWLEDTTHFKMVFQLTQDFDSNLVAIGYSMESYPMASPMGFYLSKLDRYGHSQCNRDSALALVVENVSIVDSGSYSVIQQGISFVETINQSTPIITTNDQCNLPAAAFSVGGGYFCPGSCVSFSNSSINAINYQWFFPGAAPDSSIAEIPTGICYSIPGSYDVVLIATNSNGSDTLFLNDCIIIYPSPSAQSISQSGDTLFAIAGSNSYQWYFNGNMIPGATDYLFLASSSGDYNVVAIDTNGCEVEAVIDNVVAASSQYALSGSRFVIIPNPVEDQFTIHPEIIGTQFTIEIVEHISIYNFLGEIVTATSLSFGDGQSEANVSNLQPGIYFLEISSGEKVYRLRFIKR
jgi:hypothetical protein